MSPTNSNSTHPFAEPVGGVAVFSDLVPTLLFLLGFVALTILNAIDCYKKQRWTMMRFGLVFVPMERMVALSFRTAACFSRDVRESWGMMEYIQTTYSTSFHLISNEHLQIALCALALATREGMQYDEWLLEAKKRPQLIESRAGERSLYRKWTGSTECVLVVAQSLQTAVAVLSAIPSFNAASGWIPITKFLLNLFSLFIVGGILAWIHRLKYVEMIHPVARRRLELSAIIILIVPIYRAAVSFRTASTLTTSPPSALPTKIGFYFLHLLPELVCCILSYMTDYRNFFDTDIWGDRPRARVEDGKHEISAFIRSLRYFVMPWKFPTLLMRGYRSLRKKWEARRGGDPDYYHSETTMRMRMTEDRERLLPNSSSVGWETSTEVDSVEMSLFTSHQSGKNLKEDGNGSYAPPSYSRAPTFVSSRSTLGSDASGNIAAPQPLIQEVHLWKPRLLSSLSSFSSENTQ